MLRREDRIFVITWRPGPHWKHGVSILKQDLGHHRDYFRRLTADGSVIAAGPFLDADGGGLALIRVAGSVEAQSVLDADPAIIAGVFQGTVRLLYVAFAASDDIE